MDKFINQSMVDWASHNLREPFEINLKYNSLFSKIFIVFGILLLGVSLLWLPSIFIYGAIYNFATTGLSKMVVSGLILGCIMFVIFGGMFFGVLYFSISRRSALAKSFDKNGVNTRGLKKYRWEDLQYLDYKSVKTGVRRNLAASVTGTVLFAGVQKISVEMIFADGKTFIPPLITNQPEILALLETMPVQKRFNGEVPQI